MDTGTKFTTRRDQQSVPSLAEFCSMIIGSTIQDEFDEWSAKGRDDSDYMEDDEVLDMVNVNLARESHTLLHKLLSMAISSSPASPSPLSHPAHSSYLIDLCATWVGNSDTSAVGARSFRTRLTFTSILVDVLENSGASDAWACRAVRKFARENRKAEYSTFLSIASGLARSLKLEEQVSATPDKGKSCQTQNIVAAHDRLNKWVVHMISDLWDHTQFSQIHGKAVTDFLICAYQSRLQCVQEHMEGPDISSNLVTLASCCLAKASSMQPCSEEEVTQYVSLLSGATPKSSTFNVVVNIILGDATLSGDKWHNTVITSLHDHACILRTHKLLKLEASLWASTVRVLESESFQPPSSDCDVEQLKKLAIEAVDEAESRCFGATRSMPSTPATASSGRKRPAKSPHGEWEWEDMVGSWIRRSPIVKRPRLQSSQSVAGTQRTLRSDAPAWKPTRQSCPARKYPASSSSISCSSRASTRSASEALTEVTVDEETQAPNTSFQKISKAPRIHNFASLLADAQTNVTVLHRRKSLPKPHLPRTINPTTPHRSRKENNPQEKRLILPAYKDTFASMPSDDSMDFYPVAAAVPNELLQMILQALPQGELYNICALSRSFHTEVLRALYRHVELGNGNIKQVKRFIEQISTSKHADLVQLIRALSLPGEFIHRTKRDLLPLSLLQDLVVALQSMINLKALCIIETPRDLYATVTHYLTPEYFTGLTFRLKSFRSECCTIRMVGFEGGSYWLEGQGENAGTWSLLPFLLEQDEIRDLELHDEYDATLPSGLSTTNLLPHVSVLSTSYGARIFKMLASRQLTRLKLQMPNMEPQDEIEDAMHSLSPAGATLTHLHIQFGSPSSEEAHHINALRNISRSLHNLKFLRYSGALTIEANPWKWRAFPAELSAFPHLQILALDVKNEVVSNRRPKSHAHELLGHCMASCPTLGHATITGIAPLTPARTKRPQHVSFFRAPGSQSGTEIGGSQPMSESAWREM
ncbi:hypothetical protein HWV62_40685 [Athelia sp. TMB]|nr:hypothetical protein HWV62_40685 [Athelia sp. TMB]